MYYSKQLLSRYISGNVDVKTLADTLTLKTCEVEDIHQRVIPKEVVIGKVLEVKKHPNADKLMICQLDCGTQGYYQICTAAENICEQIYVPVALPGCFLPAINLQIEPREMRGEESKGMICSKQELGIGEDLDLHGIRILRNTTTAKGDFQELNDDDLGKSLREIAPWLDNRTLEIDNKTITHRPDLFGHLGVSFEYQTLFPDSISFSQLSTLQEQLEQATILRTISEATPANISLCVESPLVSIYSLLEITDTQVQESPLWLRLQLLDLGQQPKNNRVDFGNYFMFLTGQPIHCFDAAHVDGDLIVRQAREGELFIDLFDKEHTLTADDIVIADQSKILALAGLVGGKSSGINETTNQVLIEVAHFDPVAIRKTALRLGLRTEAQIRFEKYPNPFFSLGATLLCLDELHFLGKALFGDRSCCGIASFISPEVEHQQVVRLDMDIPALYALLGCAADTLPSEDVIKIYNNLGFTLQGENKLTVPTRRGPDDIQQQIDIAEEVARIYGYDKIIDVLYTTPLTAISYTQTIALHRKLEEMRSGSYRYDQIETYPRVDERWHKLFDVSAVSCLQMENPLAPKLAFLRPSIIPNLLEAIEKNAPVYDQIRLYDIGKTRSLKRETKEQSVLGVALWKGENTSGLQSPFLDLKGKVTQMLETLLPGCAIKYVQSNFPRAHMLQQTTLLVDEKEIGLIATIHPQVVHMLGREQDQVIAVAEISLSTVEDLLFTQKQGITRTYESLQDQLVWRELSFVLDQQDNYGIITDTLHDIPEIQMVELIDLYAGEQLGDNKKSITIRFKLKGDGTWTTDQINAVMQKAIKQVEKTGAKLRGE